MARTTSFLSKNNEWSFLDENENVIPLTGYTNSWVVENGSRTVISDYKHIYSHYAIEVNPTNTDPVVIKLTNQSVPANITESSVLASRSTSDRIKYATSAQLPQYSYSDGVITSTNNQFLTIGSDTLRHGGTVQVTGIERTDATYTAAGHGFAVGDLVSVTGAAPESYNITNKEIASVTTDTFTVLEMPSNIGNFSTFAKVEVEQPAYEIGDTGPAGGKIFITPSTHGNNTGLYFEVAPVGTEVQRTWAESSFQTTEVVGADGVLIGTGAANTANIIAQGNTTAATSAAKYCDDLTYGGFVDWFLPSKHELTHLYDNRVALNTGFSSAAYWSSTETNASTAWPQNLSTGAQTSANKSTSSYVRAVRSFGEPSIPQEDKYLSNAEVSGDEKSFVYTCQSHGFTVGSFVTITGISPSTFNVVNKQIISVTTDTFSVEPYEIGDTGPGGGIIFLTPSTEGNVSEEYFEAAPAPVSVEVQRTWSTGANQTTVVSGADGTAIGTGEQNTADIVAQSGNVAATSAAKYCSDLVSGGYSDWFLPSKNELNEIYENLYIVEIGGFAPGTYWNSSEYNSTTSWAQNFSTGIEYNDWKSASNYVRPVRSFLLTSPGSFQSQISVTDSVTTSVVTNVSQNNVSYITPGHRFAVGQLVSVYETFPIEYNVTKTPITAVTPTRFTVAGISPNILEMSQGGKAKADGDEGARILVRDETGLLEKYNGVYTVTDSGSITSPWILTRTQSFPLAFNCMTRSETKNITTSIKIYESGGTPPDSSESYTSNAGKYTATRSNLFNSFSSLYSYQVDIEITVSGHGNDVFYVTLPFLYNYYGWLGNMYVQNARRQYLPHFYWDTDSQQTPDYPFYKFLDSMTYKADEVMQSYSDFFTYELSELPVDATGTETWATSTLTSPENVSLANREWLSQFTGGKLYTVLPSGVLDGSVDLDEFIEWQLVNKYSGYRAGSTQALKDVIKLCLTGNKKVTITPNADNNIWKIKIYTLISETPEDYVIGDIGPGGGKVFITPSTAGNSTGQYFEVAPVAEEVQRTWSTGANQTTVVSGADGTAIGTGEQNTADIVAQSGNVAATSAAKYCSDLVSGGKSDWFLPSKDELNQIYANSRVAAGNFIIGVTYTINTVGTTNFTLIGASANTIGVTFTATGVGSGTGVADILNTGFSSAAYWSSTESAASTAWSQNLNTGVQTSANKSTSSYVRPVRSFNTSKTVLALAELVRPMGYIYEHEAISSINFILDNVAEGILDFASLG